MKLTYLRDTAPKAVLDWATKLVTDLNRETDSLALLPGPYANDAAAAAANVGIREGYVDTAGIARRRIT
jgi:hypothetical protein